MDELLLRLETLPNSDVLLKEISKITDQGNLRAVFLNMDFFLKNGEIPKSEAGYSNLPAVIFGLSAFQNFMEKETDGKISAGDIHKMSALYFQAYQDSP